MKNKIFYSALFLAAVSLTSAFSFTEKPTDPSEKVEELYLNDKQPPEKFLKVSLSNDEPEKQGPIVTINDEKPPVPMDEV